MRPSYWKYKYKLAKKRYKKTVFTLTYWLKHGWRYYSERCRNKTQTDDPKCRYSKLVHIFISNLKENTRHIFNNKNAFLLNIRLLEKLCSYYHYFKTYYCSHTHIYHSHPKSKYAQGSLNISIVGNKLILKGIFNSQSIEALKPLDGKRFVDIYRKL